MQNLPNIEPSKFRKGEYVGYACGVWHITKSTSSFGKWCARHRDNQRMPTLFAFSLRDLSRKLTIIQPI